jgi:tRNA-(ms[2]io[6]A)-hydroxylase
VNTKLKDFLIPLQTQTPKAWIDAVLANFDAFLQDHADCERKASSMAMSLIYRAPNRTDIIPELIETALEEMVHFRQVYRIMEERGVQIPLETEKDPYIQQLFKLLRSQSEERMLDRLLLASIIETRGAERFRLVAENIEDEDLKAFYTMLYKSEEKHGNVFVEMALLYYNEESVMNRLHTLLHDEADIVRNLPIRAALH